MCFEVFRSPPLNLEENDADLFKRSSRFLVNARKILPLKNVFIFWQGQVFKRFRILQESISTEIFLNKYSSKFFLLCLSKSILRRNLKVLYSNTYLIVHDEWSFNYFHWLTDTLSRLYQAKDYISSCSLILPDSYNLSYHHYVIKKFGIKSIKRTNEKRIFFARNILLSEHTAPAGNYNPELLQNAVSYLLEGHENKLNLGERIYISRKKAVGRKVINEDEVSSFLLRQGFKIVTLEDYSFEEQLSIFYYTRILISIHGSGLTNLMFMSGESAVLELRKESGSEIYNCYFTLAAVFNQRYFYQGCKSDSSLSVQEANIYVDLEKLQKNLTLMVQLYKG